MRKWKIGSVAERRSGGVAEWHSGGVTSGGWTEWRSSRVARKKQRVPDQNKKSKGLEGRTTEGRSGGVAQ